MPGRNQAMVSESQVRRPRDRASAGLRSEVIHLQCTREPEASDFMQICNKGSCR